MSNKNNQILNKSQILQKIRRMAFQIYEDNFQEEELIFIGVDGGGYGLAQLIQQEFAQISHFPSKLVKITLDKFHPVQSDVQLDTDVQTFEDKTIILIDDVLNTGRTFAYSLRPFLKIKVKKLQTAVLIDRNHKSFPISADFVGYALSTTLQEHISVILDDEMQFGVYLS